MKIRNNQDKPKTQKTSGPIKVSGISGIPFEATPQEVFRLTIHVEQIDERETTTGNPYYFLQCRDNEAMAFSVVVWASQYARLQGRVKEGAKVELDIRVPKEGYSAFNLA